MTKIILLTVHHGEYKENFYGVGETLKEAASRAASKSSYTSALYDVSDNWYDRRASHRADLLSKLENGEPYRGFGWGTFTLIAEKES